MENYQKFFACEKSLVFMKDSQRKHFYGKESVFRVKKSGWCGERGVCIYYERLRTKMFHIARPSKSFIWMEFWVMKDIRTSNQIPSKYSQR